MLKRTLTELGAALIMLWALTGNAQEVLIGLPEHGVTLAGSLTEPAIVNHSNQTVIGHVLRVFYANSAIPVNFANFKARAIWMAKDGLQPNQSETPLTRVLTHPTVKLKLQDNELTVPAKVMLDSVVFANGQMVGPDVMQQFDKLSAHIQALQEFGARAIAVSLNPSLAPAFWAEVDRLSGQEGLNDREHWKVPLAFDFRWAHHRNADQEAFAMAARVLTLPALWRTK